jgi:hypothetical protein
MSIQLQGAIVITHCSRAIALAIQCRATAEVCFCHSRIDPQRTLVIGYRLIKSSAIESRGAAIYIRASGKVITDTYFRRF